VKEGTTHVGLHDDAVDVLQAWPPDDDLRGVFLDHLGAHTDAMYRECLPGHVTASAVVLDSSGDRVLLTLHGKLNMWLQTGGHCEPGDATVAGAALREATEESGIGGLTLLGDAPVLLDRHWVPCNGGAWHYDVQYAAVAPPGARAAISDESADLRWFPVDALPESADASVRRLVARSAPLAGTASGGPR
jgi:8-oxo-dGTP pyrophosphatase MutT (NUDIX family)